MPGRYYYPKTTTTKYNNTYYNKYTCWLLALHYAIYQFEVTGIKWAVLWNNHWGCWQTYPASRRTLNASST